MLGSAIASITLRFTIWDWGVVAAFLILTTVVGTVLAGKQATMRDFFLGGRKLPWYAVSGSIIATEISAVTFISVPSVVFKPGGNFTYLQLGLLGSVLARIIVGYVLVPQYYKREIYSPYDYMGHQLGQRVRTMTSGLFVLGAMLAQSARIYLTAQIMIVLLNEQFQWVEENLGIGELTSAVTVIGVVAIGWALVGGITTVIWTNVILFLTFFAGALIAIGTIAWHLDGGLGEIVRAGWNAKESGPWGKFTFFDFSLDPVRYYTIWTAAIASTWGGLFAYGTDQLLVQGMFCCKDEKNARRAIIGSSAGQAVTTLVMLVGVGLYAYYLQNPLSGEALEMYNKKADRIFPIYICQAIPVGLKGVVMAAALAAAISTVMGVLTALSQTVMGAFYGPLRRARLIEQIGSESAAEAALTSPAEERRNVLISRFLVVFWGIVLCALAVAADRISKSYPSILDLALAMAAYAGGALLGCFALSFLPLKVDGRGYMFSAPLAVTYVYALAWHNEDSRLACLILGAALLAAWLFYLGITRKRDLPPRIVPVAVQTLAYVAGIVGMILINRYLYWTVTAEDGSAKIAPLAWPWHIPLSSVVAVVFGYILGHRKAPEGAAAGSNR